MAGIGVKLNNIYGKNTLITDVIGMGYSTVMTIAPMLTVIGALCIMEYFLDFSSVGYVTRELFSCTVLYIFIFALLTASCGGGQGGAVPRAGAQAPTGK